MASFCVNALLLLSPLIVSTINTSPLLQGQGELIFPPSPLVESRRNLSSVSLTEKIANLTGSGLNKIKSGVTSVIINVSSAFNRTQDANENIILGAACTKNFECNGVSDAVCDRGTCNCGVDFTVAHNKPDLCLRVMKLGEVCEEDVQCSKGTVGAVCSGHHCVCSGHNTEVEGHCIPTRRGILVDELACQEDSQCVKTYGNRTACINNICDCDHGFHPYNGKCLPDLKLGDSCSVPHDCIVSKFTEERIRRVCYNSVCICKLGYTMSDNNECLKVNGYQLQASVAWLLCVFLVPYVF